MEWDEAFRKSVDRAVRRLGAKHPPAALKNAIARRYRPEHSPSRAARDLLFLCASLGDGVERVDLRPSSASEGKRHQIRIYSAGERSLDTLMPILQNLGLRVIDQEHVGVGTALGTGHVRNFIVEPLLVNGDAALQKKPILQALRVLLSGQAENDRLNALAMLAGFDWRAIDLFRAYCNYYHQLNTRVDRSRVHQALLANSEAARLLYHYFVARFEPSGWRDADLRESEALTPLRPRLAAAFDAVADIGDDRILRDMFNLIDATLRTNFFCPGAESIALKIGGLGVINMPSPKPMFEIFVHSRHMEGVHLRGAKVARGGLRWSDRLDDFRSEILDLLQTQMIKNALIVPQGAKGGFVLKKTCPDLSRRMALAQKAYATFLRGLLDVTDNMRGPTRCEGKIISYDGLDPYLVVAADKGTAGWSDRANEISADYGFWLGDAFATGGSRGYHHKRLGVTARGAWVCVKRHFRELGRNVDDETLSVVGVGSMDGDVFGNGMLLSNNIRLLGAFDGRHIFVDPDPDPKASFIERRRLFETPDSSWNDYDRRIISLGGGVFDRREKDIRLSAEARAWLGMRNHPIDGETLIRLLLTAPVDLLWMGGVGTYVKASAETQENVGDRINDGARVDANQLRAKVVGEGANLAFTQKARVEYALNGGRINTDAVDNSAGVDLSDHEVNLKILLDAAVDERERNQILAAFTAEILDSVLADNERQSLCLSLERERCLSEVTPYLDLADQLENAGALDRALESFPSRKEVIARPGHELARPELAILIAYSKLALKRALLDAPDFPMGDWSAEILAEYFPRNLRMRHAGRLRAHPLAREITATMICNKVIDQAGSAFLLFGDGLVPGLMIEAVNLYLVFDQVLQGDRWRGGVRALDGKVRAGSQHDFLLRLENSLSLMCRSALWQGLRLAPEKDVIAEWRAHLAAFLDYFGESASFSAPAPFADETSLQTLFERLRDFPVLVQLSQRSGKSIDAVAPRFARVIDLFGLSALANLMDRLSPRDSWERRLRAALDDRFRASAARIALKELQIDASAPQDLFQRKGLDARLTKLLRLRDDLIGSASPTLTGFAAFSAELDSLIEACDAGPNASGDNNGAAGRL